MSVDEFHEAYAKIRARNYSPWNIGGGLRGFLFPPNSDRRLIALALREASRRPISVTSVWKLLSFTRSYKVSAKNFYMHNLDANWRRRNDYVFNEEVIAVLHDLYPKICSKDFDDLGDKRRFAQRCTDAGLPVVSTLAYFENGEMKASPEGADIHGKDLFSKFANRYCGQGTSLWNYSGGRYSDGNSVFTLEELTRHLCAMSSEFPVILQTRLRPHTALRAISGQALSTVRVVTTKHPEHEPEVALAVFRMSVGATVADNFALGGIAAPVDLQDGTLGVAVDKDSLDRGTRYLRHPDSDFEIAGRRLPYWPGVKRLAILAHQAFGTVPSVGWDIAVTDGGAILVEGNAIWCTELAQIPHQMPLANIMAMDCIVAHLRAVA
jgi:hypothetical protein